jgi:hypothetical protein
MRIILQFAIVLGILYQPLHACRLWAVCAKSGHTISTLSSQETSFILDELTTFYYQSASMPNGWALMGYGQNNGEPVEPISRSDSPATDDSLTYWNAVNTLMDGDHTLGIGHLRMATSGNNSIPNPHPWMFYNNSISYSLIHNGTVNKMLLYNLITNNGEDETWLNQHEPQTFGNGSWKEEGWSSVVDSELILLYIMQQIIFNNHIITGLKIALTNIIDEGVSVSQINIIFSDGTNLYAYGGNNGLSYIDSDEHFAIMSLPPSNNDEESNWTGIETGEMVVINENGLTNFPEFVSTEIDDPELPVPDYFKMYPAYPNPFNGSVTILVDVISNENIDLSIYSIKGELVFTTLVHNVHIGKNMIQWDARSNQNKMVSSGSYFIRVSSLSSTETQKIVFIK